MDIFLFQNATVGTQIVKVEANDADIGPNGDVHFRLKQDLAGHWRTFEINDKSGVITLKQTLDRETQRLYEVNIYINTYSSNTIFLCKTRDIYSI